MAYEPEVTRQEEAIRHQMEETRASLADKLESLEQHVLGTVHEATSAVSGTVENVKETVEGTVESVKETMENVKESVKETFDLRLQTERHPWAVVGGSVAVGFALGHLLPRLMEDRMVAGMSEFGDESGPGEPVRPESLRGEPAAERPSILKSSFFADLIGPELEKLKNYAVESLKGMVHDFIAKSVPGYDEGRDQHGRTAYEREPIPQGHAGEEPMHSQ
jgi:ElaB/YqjD/DUF883 family membrane-anchored ribosome-binding protein